MSRRWSQFNPRHPQAQGCCDGCGFNFILADLRWQTEWRGRSLVRTGMRKCDDCLDVPNPQGRAPYIAPDPVPVRDPRIDPNIGVSGNHLVTSAGVVFTTDDGVEFIKAGDPSFPLLFINLAGTLVANGGVSGNLTGASQPVNLAGKIAAGALHSASASVAVSFAGSIPANPFLSGGLVAVNALTGALIGAPTLTGDLSNVMQLVGGVSAQPFFLGALSSSQFLTGAIVGAPRFVGGLSTGNQTLSYDFTQGTLPSGVTASGGNPGTVYNGSGQVAAGNAPRLTHAVASPFANSGILVEPARANLVKQSQFASGWTQNKITIGQGAATGPDGVAGSACSATVSQAGSDTYIAGPAFAHAVGSTYTVSAFLKAGTGQYGVLDSYDGAKDFGVVYDLVNGTVVGNRTGSGAAAPTASGMQALPNGWYRCWFTFVAQGSGSSIYASQVGIRGSASDLGFTATTPANLSIYIFGYQDEQGAAVSSYIATTSAAVTRSADAVSFTVPGGVGTLTYTFDDGSTQVVSASAGNYTVPTSLNRAVVASVVGS